MSGGVGGGGATPPPTRSGSGCREHSYGGFGGGHPHFHPHATPVTGGYVWQGRLREARPVTPVRMPDYERAWRTLALSKLTVLPELCAEEADSSVRELSVEPQSRVSAAASQPSA